MPQDIQNSAPAPMVGSTAPSTSNGGGGGDLNTEALKLLQQYMSKPQQHLAPPPPKPASMGQNIKEAAVGMIPVIGAGVQKAIKEQRDYQINEVVNKIAQWDSVYQELQMMTGGDQQKLQEAVNKDPRLDALRKDKKFIKGMQKVFGGDLLSPEKQNTIYHEAMKKTIQLKDAKGKVQQASQFKDNASMLNAMPQQAQMPDSSKVAGLESAMRRDINSTELNDIRRQQLKDNEAKTADKEKLDREKFDEQKRKTAEQERFKNASLKERHDDFAKTDEYRRWKEKLDTDTRIKTAVMQQTKPSQTLQPVAVFSRTGLHQLKDAQDALGELQKSGVLDGVLRNKLEDAIFGKGYADPSLDANSRRLIGKVRTAMAYTSSAGMRAHTGRTSKEIYDDFKNTLRIGQDKDALFGAIEQTTSMLQEYADVITPQAQESLRKPVDRSKTRPKLPKGAEIQD